MPGGNPLCGLEEAVQNRVQCLDVGPFESVDHVISGKANVLGGEVGDQGIVVPAGLGPEGHGMGGVGHGLPVLLGPGGDLVSFGGYVPSALEAGRSIPVHFQLKRYSIIPPKFCIRVKWRLSFGSMCAASEWGICVNTIWS